MKLVVVAFIMTIAGCSSAGKQGETLIESVRTYHEGIRWQRIPIAASRIPPDERADFITEWDQLADDLRITDYEVVSVTQGDKVSKVEVKYTWYLDSRQIVHETRAREEWERHGEVWIKVGDHRIRGEKMPGLAEPDAEDGSEAEPDDRVSDVSLEDSVEARGD